MVISTLRIVSAPGSRGALVRILTAHLNATRLLPGCRRCDLYENLRDRQILTLVEEWESQAALDFRLASEGYHILPEVMGQSQEPPEIHFDTVSHRAGLELIETARQESRPEQRLPSSENPSSGMPAARPSPAGARRIVPTRRSGSMSGPCRQSAPRDSVLRLRDPSEPAIAVEIHARVQRMQEAIRALQNGADLSAKQEGCDRIIQEAEALQRYEAQGILTTVPLPSTLLRDFQAKRDAFARMGQGARETLSTSGKAEPDSGPESA